MNTGLKMDGSFFQGEPTPFGRKINGLMASVVIVTIMTSALWGNEPEVVAKPSLSDVKTFTQGFFKNVDGYRPGDLVTREETVKLLAAFNKKGWGVRNKDEFLDRVLAKDSFLVRQLSDEKGRAFLRDIERLPGGIDRVDRLSRLPQGEVSVNDLIRKVPNGTDWIKAMTTTRRGEILGDRLSNSRDGRDFNEPTGRIYTERELAGEIHANLVPVKRSVSIERRER